tara:strand:- start:136823 stop:137473 length:651 start_codon:yes stop_codon:yes gene_type:complete
MNGLKYVLASAVALVAGAGQVQAGVITSAGDSALIGATIETFDSAALAANYSSLTLTDLTVSASGTFALETGSNGSYVPPNPIGDQFIRSYQASPLLTFAFDSNVSAFGIQLGATNRIQTITAYDIGDNVIDTHTVPDQVSTLPFPYTSFLGISSNSANIAKFTITSDLDDWVADDLYYVTGSPTVPEPASLAIFGAMSLAACGMGRRRRKALLAA